jgi:hypothetical protein
VALERPTPLWNCVLVWTARYAVEHENSGVIF